MTVILGDGGGGYVSGEVVRSHQVDPSRGVCIGAQVYVCAERIDDDGARVELAIPLAGEGRGWSLAIEAHAPPGWTRAARAAWRAWRDELARAQGLPGGAYVPLASTPDVGDLVVMGHGPEVGFLDDILGVLTGGASKGAGGLLGLLGGGGGGGGAADALAGLLGASPARPQNLPAVGSRANRTRILAILGIRPGWDLGDVRGALREATGRGWDRGDLADASAMLGTAQAMGSGTLSAAGMERLTTPATQLSSLLSSGSGVDAATLLAALTGDQSGAPMSSDVRALLAQLAAAAAAGSSSRRSSGSSSSRSSGSSSRRSSGSSSSRSSGSSSSRSSGSSSRRSSGSSSSRSSGSSSSREADELAALLTAIRGGR